MHIPSHSAALPTGVDPIPVPDTKREAELLCLLLDAGLYPQAREVGEEDEAGARFFRAKAQK